MSFNGAGTFTIINTFVYDTIISETDMNTNFSDIATGLSTCITKNGQTAVTANIPMANYKFTGVGAGSAATDSVNLGQVQAQAWKWCGTAGGTADALTLTPSPAITAYAAGQSWRFIAASNNTGAATVAVSGLATRAIQLGGSALSADEIVSGKLYQIDDDGTQYQLTLLSGPYGYTDPLTTRGDIVYRNASATTRLAIGADNTVLKSDGTDAAWGSVTGANIAIGSDAQGDILYRNATTWTRLGAGTSGQFLQTQGAGANPQWAAQTFGLVPISTTAVSGASGTVTGIDGSYNVYIVHILDFAPATDNVDFWARLTVGGVAQSGASDYTYAVENKPADAASANTGSSAAAQILGNAGNGWGNATNEKGEVIITIYKPNGGNHVIIKGQTSYIKTSGAIVNGSFSGAYIGAVTAVDGLDVRFSSGNCTGTINLYGVKIPT